MFAIPLALSLVGLTVGPALMAIGRKQTLLFVALEGLTLSLVPTLILLRLLPHLYEESGPPAIVLLVVGYVLFWLIERRSHRTGAYLGRTVVVPAMAVHSLLDGGSLAVASATDYGPASALLLGALVLHRVPEGLLLATTLTPELGFRSMLRAVAVVGTATVIGALGGRALLESAPHAAIHCFVAFGLGMMLRLVVHRHAPPPTRPLHRGLGGVGFLAGIVILSLVRSSEDVLRRAQPRELAIFESLGPLFVETAPALLLGLAGVVVLGTLFPRGVVAPPSLGARLRRALNDTDHLLIDHVTAAYVLGLLIAAGLEAAVPADWLAPVGEPFGMLLGALLALPFSGCPLATILPAMILLHKGAPTGAAVTFVVVASSSRGLVLARRRRHLGLRASVVRGSALLALAVAAGLVADAVLPRGNLPDLHGLLARRHDALEWAAALVTIALVALSVLRAGPWAWLGVGAGGCESKPHAHNEPH